MAIQIYWRRITWIAVGACAVIATLGGLQTAVTSGGNGGALAVGLLDIAIFGTLAVRSGLKLRDKRPVLVFTADGLRDPTGRFMLGDLDWSMIRKINTRERAVLLPIHRIRITLDAKARSARPLSLADSARLFARTMGGSIKVLTLAVETPPRFREQLVELAPPSVAIT